jgi:hypothetical protein
LLFSDLPIPVQLSFGKRALRFTVLSDKSDSVVRFDLFERLNTGGISLTSQEVRACIFRGKFSDFIQEMAAYENLIAILKLQPQRQEDGTIEELVLKFFAYLHNQLSFRGEVTLFLNFYMENASKDFNIKEGEILFKKSVDKLFEILNNRKFLRSNYGNTPLNQFEAVIVGIGKMITENKRIYKPIKNWLEDEELVKASGGGSNTQAALTRRINRAITLLSKR